MKTNKLVELINIMMGAYKDSFLYNIMNFKDSTLPIEECPNLGCIKISEKILNRKLKSVQTELVFLTMEEDGYEFLGVVTIVSTVNNLTKDKVRFSNYRDFTIREMEDDDTLKFIIAAKYFDKYPECNNLLGMEVMARNEKGVKVSNRTLFEKANTKSVIQIQI